MRYEREKVDEAVKMVLGHVPAAHVMAYFEASLMRQMMERLGHNQSQVAHALNLNRATLRKRLAAYDIIEVRRYLKGPPAGYRLHPQASRATART